MAGNASDYLELKILDHLLGTTTFVPPGGYWAALLNGGVELTDGGYARQAASFGAAAARKASNSSLISFGPFAGQVTFDQVLLYDASSVGNQFYFADVSQVVDASKTFDLAAGQLEYGHETGAMSDYAANAWLDFLFGHGTLALVSPHLAVMSAYTSDSIFTEIAAFGRVASVFDAAVGPAAIASNSFIDEFGTDTVQRTVVHGAIFDAASAGNMILRSAMGPYVIEAGEVPRFPAGAVDVTMD